MYFSLISIIRDFWLLCSTVFQLVFFIVNYYCCFVSRAVLPLSYFRILFLSISICLSIYLSICVTWVVPGINAFIGWLSAFWRIITFIVYKLQQLFLKKKCCLAIYIFLPNLSVKDRKCRYRGVDQSLITKGPDGHLQCYIDEISVEKISILSTRYFDSLLIVNQLITETSYRWLVLKLKHLAHINVPASVSHVWQMHIRTVSLTALQVKGT